MMNRLQDGSIASVVIWQADGEIIWASDKAVSAAGSSTTTSSTRRSPRRGLRRRLGSRGARRRGLPDGAGGLRPHHDRRRQYAIEAYYLYEGVEREAGLLRGQLIPLAIGALVVLQLVQIPIAASLAGRLRRRELERAELTERSLTASEAERRAIAADLHDGPVQDLAGVGYALSGLRDAVPPNGSR